MNLKNRVSIVTSTVLVATTLVLSVAPPVSAGDSAGALAGRRRGAAASLSAGAEHTCALLDQGTISCWGRDDDGQVGNGDIFGEPSTYQSPVTTPLPNGDTAKGIAAGGVNSCVVLADDSLTCWGLDDSGQIGDGPGNANLAGPGTIVATPATMRSIAVNVDFSCGLFSNGAVRCWGSDDDGQLGNGGPDVGVNEGDVDSVVNAADLALPGQRTASAVSAGARHACAVLDDRKISCWGDNADGQVGSGSTASVVTAPSAVLTLPTGRTAEGVSAGGSHTCALLDNGDVTCWGADVDGQLGNGAVTGDVTKPPVRIALPGPAVAVATGRAHSCAVLADDRLFCWGDDSQGQVGTVGANADAPSPVNIPLPAGAAGAQAVALGDNHTCVLLNDGSVSCWGSDSSGQLGNGAAGSSDSPGDTTITGLTVAVNDGAPEAPRSVMATGGRVNVQLTWSAPLDDGGQPITGYRIQQSVDGGVTWALLVADTNSLATTATLAAGVSAVSRFRVAAINSIGPSPYSVQSNSAVVSAQTDIQSFTPIRILDTRANGETIDGQFEMTGLNAGGKFLRVPVAGRGGPSGVPSNALAAVLNVTAVNADPGGFATVYPCDEVPNASTLNFPALRNVANAVVAKLDADGSVCIFTDVDAHLAVDATGFVPFGSQLTPVEPARLYDTRASGETVDGARQREGVVSGGTFTEVTIAGRAGSGVPADATVALLNLVAVNPQVGGFATLYPCGTRPNTSTLNFDADVNKATAAVAKLTSSGSVCVFAEQNTNFIIDVTGYAIDSTLESTTPARLLDTRSFGTTIDRKEQGTGVVAGGSFRKLPVAGRGGVPDDATLVALSVVAVNALGKGFFTVYPCGTQPLASTLNFEAGQNVANLALTALSADGAICVFTDQPAHIVVDVTAYQ